MKSVRARYFISPCFHTVRACIYIYLYTRRPVSTPPRHAPQRPLSWEIYESWCWDQHRGHRHRRQQELPLPRPSPRFNFEGFSPQSGPALQWWRCGAAVELAVALPALQSPRCTMLHRETTRNSFAKMGAPLRAPVSFVSLTAACVVHVCVCACVYVRVRDEALWLALRGVASRREIHWKPIPGLF